MKARALFYVLVLSGLLVVSSGYAEVKLPAIISSNMVLQRNTTVTLWGWADSQEEIVIKASWLNEELKTVADKDGNWKIEVKTMNSKAPQTIEIKSADSHILLEDVLFGEVWLCSGQSNMQQSVSGYYGQPTFGSQGAITTATNENLRLFTAERQADTAPKDDLKEYRGWQSASPSNVKDFSAVAYFYGQQLQEILDVPVGMIHSSWGGSLVEAWISKEVLSSMHEVDLSEVDLSM